ncbi:extracellular solute-binding protein [Paenibacillus mesophilus]|uniref:extracellular solute-binding protein n=1 Tax=Paenibacillus mesophilus TaxID=2582849 RepID=UPI00110D572C|nr:extracellular solute-binding protein [Paenibacillus mesophilus]TMV44380.1 extracellular solute-binding protein [Paenibacillus mesophilus]
MNWHDNDLLMEHYDRIKRYIAYKAGIDQAEDLTQQVFLKANQSLNSFQNKSSLYTWLYSIASNTMMKEARRAYRTKELLVGQETNFSRFITTDFTKEVDFKIDLGTSLNKLDQIDQEILTLRYIADYSFRDIAKLLKLNESMIKNRMYRCLGKMRNDLENWHIAAPFNPKQYINMVNMLETGQSGPEFQKVTDDFMSILRQNFRRITSALNFTPHTKIAYEIYPDQESMFPEAHPSKKSFIGRFGQLNVVKIVSPLNPGPHYDYNAIVLRSLALYSKVLTKQLNPQIPLFLLHGVGEYLGQEWSREQVRSRVASRYRQRELPSIQYLRVVDSLKFLTIGGRELGYTLIDFIVIRYSWDALHRLLRDPGNLESIFGCTQSQFEAEWKQFLMEQVMDDACDSPGAVISPEQPSSKERSLTILIPDHDAGSTRYRIATFIENAQAFKSANPGTEVTIDTMPIRDFHGAKFLERIGGSNDVDLVFWPYGTAFSRQGLFVDLLHFYKEDGITPDDLYKPLTEMMTEDGQLTGIPMSPQPLAVFYNRDWFNRANLPEPTEEWTWEQFFALSVHLKEANTVRGKEIYGSAVPIIPDLLESLAQSNGGSMLSPDNSRFTGYLDSRPVTEAFALLLKEINNQDVVKKLPNGTNAILSEISSGNVGMCVGRIGMYAFLTRNPKLKERIGVAPLPRLASGVRANAVWIQDALSIATASKQQQLAWKFIKDIVLNPESKFQVDWSKQETLASRSSIHKLKLNDEPAWKVFIDELNHAVKPVIYRNPKIKMIATADKLFRLASLGSEAEVQMELSRLASVIDGLLDETKPMP